MAPQRRRMLHPAAALGVFLAQAPEALGRLELVSLAELDPEAVCVDGSPSGYYWEAAPGDTREDALWILHLQGGEWCYDGESCEARCGGGSTHPLCSSRQWETSYADDGCQPPAPCSAGGLFRPNRNEALRRANKAFVRYCTSDAHVGDAEAFGFQFRGARVVRAVIADLVRRGLGGGERGHKLLLGGGSAGARGAMLHLDAAASLLGGRADNVEIIGFLDSPLWMDVPPIRGGVTSFKKQTQDFVRYAKVSDELLGEECLDQYSEARWKCVFSEYRVPFVKSRYLLVASQNDQYQLKHNIGHRPDVPEEVEYTKSFAYRIRDLAQRLTNPRHLWLSWSCYSHNLATTDRFDNDRCQGGHTIQDALEEVLGLAEMRPGSSFVDDCEGFSCGLGCDGAKPPATSAGGDRVVLQSRPPGDEPHDLLRQPSRDGAVDLLSDSPLGRAAGAEQVDLAAAPEPEGSPSFSAAVSGPAAEDAEVRCPQGVADAGPLTLEEFKRRMASTYSSAEEAFDALHLSAVDLWNEHPRAPSQEPLNAERFARGCETFEPPLAKEEALFALAALDADGDGKLTSAEFVSGVRCQHFRPLATAESGEPSADAADGLPAARVAMPAGDATAKPREEAGEPVQQASAWRDARSCGTGEAVTVAEFKSCMLKAYSSAEDAVSSQGSHAMNIDEFIRLTKTFKPPLTESEARNAFQTMDSNHDGRLPALEFLVSLGMSPPPGTERSGERRISGDGAAALGAFALASCLLVNIALVVARLCTLSRSEEGDATGREYDATGREYWAVSLRRANKAKSQDIGPRYGLLDRSSAESGMHEGFAGLQTFSMLPQQTHLGIRGPGPPSPPRSARSASRTNKIMVR